MVTAAAMHLGRDELWKRRPALAADCDHDLVWLQVIEVRQSVVCRKCGGLDVETSGRMLTEPARYAPDDDGVRLLDSAPPLRVTLEGNRGEEETG